MDHQEITRRYIQHVLETGTPPASVYSFAKDLEISERDFYSHFGSFDGLESRIWEGEITATIQAVEAGAEWDHFNAQQKLLTFYYALCERVLDQRSFFLLRFPRKTNCAKSHPQLRAMKDAFVGFASQLVEAGTKNGEIASRGSLSKTYPAALYGHFLSVIEFNLEDSSQGFERTDAYIEKSVRLAFDMIRTQAVDSALDLLRFLRGRSWVKPEGA